MYKIYKYTATTAFCYLCESEREKVHGDRGYQLSVGKGKSGYTVIFISVFEIAYLYTTSYYWRPEPKVCVKYGSHASDTHSVYPHPWWSTTLTIMMSTLTL